MATAKRRAAPKRKSKAPAKKRAVPSARTRTYPAGAFAISLSDSGTGRSIRGKIAAFGTIRSAKATASRIAGGEWPDVYRARVTIVVDPHRGKAETWEGKGRGRTDEEAVDDALDDLAMQLPELPPHRWGDAR